MLEFIELRNRLNQLYYSVRIDDDETFIRYSNGEWVMKSPEGHGNCQYTQKELKQILKKLAELNGEEE